MDPSSPRYAIYFAPEPDTPLAAFGRAWLGRDAGGGPDGDLPVPKGFSRRRWEEATRSARHYGFHGTLKPPFSLAPGRTADGLAAAAERFAVGRVPFDLPALRVAEMDGFVALVPTAPRPALDRLAADSVTGFDGFRAPSTPEAMEARRRRGLTPSQEGHLQRWGYPYVMADFRFHITLTGRLPDPAERSAAVAAAAEFRPAFPRTPTPVRSVCLFGQSSIDAPFRLLRRFPFRGGDHERFDRRPL